MAEGKLPYFCHHTPVENLGILCGMFYILKLVCGRQQGHLSAQVGSYSPDP